MTDDTALRLVDLLADQRLGLRLMSEADPQTPILGAHSIEVEHPTRWLRPGWLMLTTGARFGGRQPSADTQRELIRDLDTAGIAALGFGVGVSLDAIPPVLLKEADRRGFPVLSVPFELPFLQVIDVVNEATLTPDVHLLKRTVTIQNYLLESLADDRPDASLVRRLAELLRSTVVLYDRAGNVVASSGVGPTQIVRTEIRTHPDESRRFTVGRWHVLTEPISTGPVSHTLAIASRRPAVSEALAAPAMEAAGRLLTTILRSRDAGLVEDRLRRTELLRMLLDADHGDPRTVWDRLELYGFQRAEPLRLLVVDDLRRTPDGARPLSGSERLEHATAVQKAADDSGLRLLLAGHDQQLVGVVDAPWSRLEPWLARLPATFRIGVSEPFRDLDQARARLHEAERALLAAARAELRYRRFEDVGLVDWLVAGRAPEAVTAKARWMLEPLRDKAALLAALTAYFDAGCDIQRTARRLALHPNSVRYRLRRVEELLDRDLRAPIDIAELHLCLQALPADDQSTR